MNGLEVTLLDDGGLNREYDVAFIDVDTKKTLYSTKLKPGFWARLSRTYLSNIDVLIQYQGQLVKKVNSLISETGESRFKGLRVYIIVDSIALGDSIAWIPYCLKFQQVHQCRVVVSSSKSELFKAAYPELEFVEYGEPVEDLIAKFQIGVFGNSDREPFHPGVIPMQKVASSILGLDHEEIEPKIDFTPGISPYTEKYICIATRASGQFKQWYCWKELVIELYKLGYRVIETSIGAEPVGAEFPEDMSIKNIMNILYHADLFIGLSSGLSWLNWAIKKHTVMISNFTKSFYEFQSRCTRITNTNVCHGCWNDPLYQVSQHDFYWCPRHKNKMLRQFECHRKISLEDVLLEVIPCLSLESTESII